MAQPRPRPFLSSSHRARFFNIGVWMSHQMPLQASTHWNTERTQRSFTSDQSSSAVLMQKLKEKTIFLAEQIDAEGLGRKLLLTTSGDPRRAPEKQTVGTVTASHKMLTLQALSSSLNAGTAKRGCLGRGEAFGCPPAVCPPKGPHPFV